ncbi:uncharacterized protein LOC111030338 isoform X2 [Myzus persicae]|uniref:uncharacterized protein LOC111030338 isoform X2 n=1 Tax=Myzus persicae TaxID=13164 RepID=UPI000B936DBE|nr:uncharacterized protein LOC111030338 isoform X2 [Myzus persicae]
MKMIDTWNLKISRADRSLTKKDGVCELHFVSEDIISCRVFEDTAGNEMKYELKKVILNPTAIPCIFPNLPSCFNKSSKKRRTSTERSTSPQNVKKNKPSDINAVNETIVSPQLATEVTDNYTIESLRYNVHTDANNIKLPGAMWGLHTDYSEKTLFTHIKDISNDKCVMFTTPNVAKVYIREKETQIEEYIEKRDDIENLLSKIDLLNICPGINSTKTNQWSSKCMLYVEDECVRCKYCQNLGEYMNRNKSQQKPKLKI